MTYLMKTTLNKIRARWPCEEGWAKLIRGLNKTGPDDEPLLLETVLDLNGLPDAIWCLRAVDRDRDTRLFAVWCARQVEHRLTDERSRNVINVAERFANGLATAADLAAAWADADDASAASAAARAAAWADADDASAAARAAAGAAARAAAGAAARAAATAAARAAASAARAAASAARAAARADADDATAAATAAAGAAAGAAATAQSKIFRSMCRGLAPWQLQEIGE